MNEAIALEMRGVSVSFGSVQALRDVSLTVLAGEVHALVGENGAGKSTLMGVAAGSLQPQTGAVRIAGAPLEQSTPAAARNLGLNIVRQHPALLPDLTVAENLALGLDPGQRVLRPDLNDWAADAMSYWKMDIDPRAVVSEVPLPHRFVIEISKATLAKPKVVLFDEPTEHLGAAEVDLLHQLVNELCSRGTGVVYISHRIPEVRRFSNRLTVLRDGQLQGTFATTQIAEPDIVTLALGRSVSATFPGKATVLSEPALVVSSLQADDFHDVSFEVGGGEVVGLAGIDGSGQRSVLSTLTGARKATGTVVVNGNRLRLGSVRNARRSRLAYIPEDRHTAGLFLPLSVGENITAAVAGDHTRWGVLRRSRLRELAASVIDAYDVKTASPDAPISSLSGGNQQKALLARAVLERPAVLLADEPTQGVDAGARVQIYRTIRDLCAGGSGVLVLSSDAVELAGLCDRVLVMSRGRVIRELTGPEVTAEKITQASLTSTSLRDSGGRPRRKAFAGATGALPAAVVTAAIVALGILATARNDFYATDLNVTNLLTLFAPLAFVAMGQLCALLLGGIDLSVGPAMGLTVVACSFLLPATGGWSAIGLAVLAAIVVTAAVGSGNGWFISQLRMSPVIATLATYMAILGVAQILRPQPAGVISADFSALIQTTIGPVPIAALVAVGVAVVLELALKRTGWGCRLRATGSAAHAAAWLGVNTKRVRLFGYLLGSALACVGGILLAAQTGVGDAAVGTSFTFASVTAVVLGGASIYGGRGSFVGALLGAALVAQVNNVTTFLGLQSAWQYFLLAILTIAAAGIYSRIGESRR